MNARGPFYKRVPGYYAGVFVADTVIALLLSRLAPATGGFWDNFVYSQCIGLAILTSIILPRLLTEPSGYPKPIMTLVLVVIGTPVGFILGTAIGAKLLGQPVWFMSGSTRDFLTLPIMTTTVLASLGGTAFFWTRENLIKLRLEAETERARAEGASRQASEAQLKMIRAQLEPHMLFNTLANLRALMSVDPPRAQAMLDRLIAFLRATLSASRADRVTLAGEFALLGDYLELIAIRMGTRLNYSLDLPAELQSEKVLPMLLQPLVENAIRHGLEPSVDGGRIDVQAAKKNGVLTLTVADTGLGFPAGANARTMSEALGAKSDTGFGLSQVRERLSTAYGAGAALAVESPRADTGSGTRVSLTIPELKT